MAVRILIPTPLRPYVDGREALDVEGGSVGELLERLAGEHTGLKRHLFADDGRLRSFVNVYVNDRDIRQLAQRDTPVKPGDTVSIIPSIAGGTGGRTGTGGAGGGGGGRPWRKNCPSCLTKRSSGTRAI
jgi:molybdopterin converting factor small subunit